MKRNRFKMLAGVTVMLCVLTAAAWVLSYRYSVAVYAAGRMAAVIDRGSVGCGVGSTLPQKWGWKFFGVTGPSAVDEMDRHYLGFGIIWRSRLYALCVPFWFVELGLLPGSIWLIRFSRRIKLPGFCSTCGYDVRATPDRCPECGTIRGKAEG